MIELVKETHRIESILDLNVMPIEIANAIENETGIGNVKGNAKENVNAIGKENAKGTVNEIGKGIGIENGFVIDLIE